MKSLSGNTYLSILAFISILFLKTEISIAQRGDHVPGDILVMLKQGSDVNNLVKHSLFINGKVTGLKAEQNLSRRLNIWQLHFDFSSVNENEVLNVLKENSDVLIAQFNHYVESRNTPNDANFGQQWNMRNIGQTGGTSGSDIRATSAWDIATGGLTAGGDTIVIAIIDQGFDLNHPDLHYWKNYHEIPGNGIDDDGNGYKDDYDGWNALDSSGVITSDSHGTHVSGIAGARGNNAIGVTGVNWNVQIMPIKGNSGIESIVVAGYSYVMDMRARYNTTNGSEGAFVVSANSSFGVNNGQPANYPLWCAMYDSMGKYGILHATATANANWNIDVMGDMPTACPSDFMISVTNTTSTDQKNGSAAYGLTTIDLGAPGTTILSTYSQGGYGTLTGCSMASPHVAGAVALLYSLPCPGLVNDYRSDPAGAAFRIKNFILNGIDTLPDLLGKTVSGGRLNVYNSMLLAAQYYNCPVGSMQPDASISGITFPTDTLSSTEFEPQVIIRNNGADTLFYASVNFKVDNQNPGVIDFNGSLPSGATTPLTLPSYTSSPGQHTAYAWTSSPNHGIDQVPSNDTASVNFKILDVPPCQNDLLIIGQANTSTDQPIITVQYPCEDIMHVQVVNILGQVIMEANWSIADNPSFNIDLSHVPAGIYFFVGRIGNDYLKKKLMIVRK